MCVSVYVEVWYVRVELWYVRVEVWSVRVEVGLHAQPAVSVVKTTLSVCVAERNNGCVLATCVNVSPCPFFSSRSNKSK